MNIFDLVLRTFSRLSRTTSRKLTKCSFNVNKDEVFGFFFSWLRADFLIIRIKNMFKVKCLRDPATRIPDSARIRPSATNPEVRRCLRVANHDDVEGRLSVGTFARRCRRRRACSRCAFACVWSGWRTGWTPSRTPRTCGVSRLKFEDRNLIIWESLKNFFGYCDCNY